MYKNGMPLLLNKIIILSERYHHTFCLETFRCNPLTKDKKFRIHNTQKIFLKLSINYKVDFHIFLISVFFTKIIYYIESFSYSIKSLNIKNVETTTADCKEDIFSLFRFN